MASSEVGRSYVNLLYRNSQEIATLLMQDPLLRKEVRKLINELLPYVNSLQEGKKVSLSKGKIAHIDSVLKRFESKASPQLKKAIKKVRRDVRKGIVFKRFGMSVQGKS